MIKKEKRKREFAGKMQVGKKRKKNLGRRGEGEDCRGNKVEGVCWQKRGGKRRDNQWLLPNM